MVRGTLKPARAFTLVELLVVMAIIGILAAMLLPSLGRSVRQADRIQCLNNLRQIGLAFQQFADDHHSRYPMQVAAADGGAREATGAAGKQIGFFALASANFPVVERELVTPKLLVCRSEQRPPAETFANLTDENVSYLLATNAIPGSSASVLAADRNLEEQAAPASRGGDTNTVLIFGTTMHRNRGNVLLADGRVEWLRGISYLPYQPATNAPPPPPAPGVHTTGPGNPGERPQPLPPVFAAGGGKVPGPTARPNAGAPPAAKEETNQTARTPALPDGLPELPGTVSFIPVGSGAAVGSNWWWWLLLLLLVAIWWHLRKREEDELQPAARGAPAGMTLTNAVADTGTMAQTDGMKRFFTGAAINADLLVTMLEKHGINARQEHAHEEARENEDEFSRETIVYVPEADYDRAYQLFYAERQDEL